jgi:hypothetical protein
MSTVTNAAKTFSLLRFHRPRPALQTDLLAPRHTQRPGRRVLGDGRDRAARAYRHRRHQHAVAADVHIGFNHRAVLVGAVVVGGDAAGAVVDALTHRGVAQVGEVIRLGAFGQVEVFDFDEVADVLRRPTWPRGAGGKSGPISAGGNR